jgi:AAA15 family ATPase/GTPase
MLKSIKIKNFRGIKQLSFSQLQQINLFVGDNATGKTAVLDAIYILINPGNPQLPLKINDWRNLNLLTPAYWRSLFFDFNPDNEIKLEAYNGEKRVVKIKPKIAQNTSVSTSPALQDVANGQFKASSEIEQELNGLEIDFKINKQNYHASIESKSLQSAKFNGSSDYQPTLQGHYFNNHTYAQESNLAAKFDIVNQEIGKEKIINFLTKFKNGIEDIELDRFNKLLVKDASFGDKRVHLNTYGDGMIRGLHMILNILAKKAGVTLIDEVENGLHWSKQEILWKFIHALVTENNQQLFITTHSKEMVKHLYDVAVRENFTELIKVYRLQAVDNALKSVAYNQEQLKFAITQGEEFR